ncbi:MAG: response regulator, partial [Kiritimatiellaeota bacterium]|nr:response regulator [Kiritimatiellota bacterium]
MKQVLLVIDDDENMIRLISAICRQSLPEVQVVTALNGTRGLQLARSEKPGVVVLDVKLPDINGFEVCRQLRADPLTLNTHILMISGVMMEAKDRVQGIQSGADGYLFKPFDPEELVLNIQALFRWWEAEQAQREKLENLVAQRTKALMEAEAGRRVLAEQMQQLQKEQSLSRLAGGVAHDFNNLLQAVIGNAEMALEALPVGVSGRSHLEELMSSIQRMAELTRQMLVYSGGNPFARRAVDLNQLLQGLNLRLDAGLPAAISLRYELAAVLPPMEGDDALLKQAVRTLVQNAGEALGAQPGSITIRTGVVALSGANLARANVGRDLPPGAYLTLEVSDTGCGMDEAVQKHIFDPFFSTKLVGRGLGLPMVAGVMRAHNGAIFF